MRPKNTRIKQEWVFIDIVFYCILQSISRDGVERMMAIYPEYTPKFCKDLMADYSCSLWGNEEDVSEAAV